MNAPPNQIAFWLPPPITAREAAAIIGKLGGQATARIFREKRNAKAREMLREMNMPVPEILR